MNRNQENDLFLGSVDGEGIRLVEFDTKSKKSRDSNFKTNSQSENVAKNYSTELVLEFIVESKLDF